MPEINIENFMESGILEGITGVHSVFMESYLIGNKTQKVMPERPEESNEME